ncbi:MAG: uroporphyrinogen decarboxylase family protein [Eubacteriales bacterium]|nr:uroporphyrinogen decarboxylase family protein [Eubacteriales bacterium]
MAIDLQAFWAEDARAHEKNCFAQAKQAALGIRMSGECVYEELGEKGDPWLPEEKERAKDLYRRYNDKAEQIVGVRLLDEHFWPDDAEFPYVRRIGEVFGGRYIIQNGTEWLDKCIEDEKQLEKVLERVEKMDFREFMLPANWESEKRRIFEQYGRRPPLCRHIRGPVTQACSLMGTQDFLYFLIDEDELAQRFSAAITRAALEMARVMDEEAGADEKSEPGFSFADDNCCLLSPELYEKFGYPVLRDVFAHYSPNKDDKRYQHSDSAMAHLLPILGRLDLNGVNFGPTVLVPEIRKYLPNARIDGCIDPMAFMRNERETLRAQMERDIADAYRYGGVNIATAGSINNGSSLESLRFLMEIIWEHRR